jgi:solute carrier family 35 protein F1/2
MYIFYLLYQRGREEVAHMLKKRGITYLLLSFVDVEANYFGKHLTLAPVSLIIVVVKAYQYTSITSVMLLDCFTIPCVMVLSRIFLKATYSKKQYIAVALCLSGLFVLVVSDYFYNPKDSGSKPILGDICCLLGAFLYAVSNVGEEVLVKKNGRSEWLSMIGVGGTVISGIQLYVFDHTLQ